ncbi:MAG TPA: hypothetical protein H9983_01280 [Candidatus Kurthia intestinigallinarum]|nr:hypothetical protein [Candidatus Kurthia intestinigallinarum]
MMNNTKRWLYSCLTIIFIQMIVVLFYLTGLLSRFPESIASIVWLVAGFLGLIIGFTVALKKGMSRAVDYLAFSIMIVGGLLIIFYVIAMFITSM